MCLYIYCDGIKIKCAVEDVEWYVCWGKKKKLIKRNKLWKHERFTENFINGTEAYGLQLSESTNIGMSYQSRRMNSILTLNIIIVLGK